MTTVGRATGNSWMLSGIVNSAGGITAGGGFSVTKLAGMGGYRITALSALPWIVWSAPTVCVVNYLGSYLNSPRRVATVYDTGRGGEVEVYWMDTGSSPMFPIDTPFTFWMHSLAVGA